MYSKGREDRIPVYVSKSTKEASKMLRKITNCYLKFRDSKIDGIFEVTGDMTLKEMKKIFIEIEMP